MSCFVCGQDVYKNTRTCFKHQDYEERQRLLLLSLNNPILNSSETKDNSGMFDDPLELLRQS